MKPSQNSQELIELNDEDVEDAHLIQESLMNGTLNLDAPKKSTSQLVKSAAAITPIISNAKTTINSNGKTSNTVSSEKKNTNTTNNPPSTNGITTRSNSAKKA
jgi:hypothetical protein